MGLLNIETETHYYLDIRLYAWAKPLSLLKLI